MKIKVDSTGHIITIDEHYWSQTANWGIEKIVFADNTEWNLATINANAYIRGTSGNDSIGGTNWNDSLYGDAGNDTMSGAGGSDTFVFRPDFGKDTITDFVAGAGSADVVEVVDDVFADFASVLAAASQVGSDTLISFDVDNTILLKNVAMGNLHQDDFRFLAA